MEAKYCTTSTDRAILKEKIALTAKGLNFVRKPLGNALEYFPKALSEREEALSSINPTITEDIFSEEDTDIEEEL